MPKEQWEKKERKDAILFNAKQTPGSGNKWGAKGDSKSETFLIENKTTAKENFTVVGKVWKKIEKEALLESRIPLLSVEFGEKTTELIILSKNDFLAMIETEKKLKLDIEYLESELREEHT